MFNGSQITICCPVTPSLLLCVHLAISSRVGSLEAGDWSRPVGGHVGDSLSHPETLEGNYACFLTLQLIQGVNVTSAQTFRRTFVGSHRHTMTARRLTTWSNTPVSGRSEYSTDICEVLFTTSAGVEEGTLFILSLTLVQNIFLLTLCLCKLVSCAASASRVKFLPLQWDFWQLPSVCA